MKRILTAVVLVVMAGGAYAADFTALQSIKVSDVEAEKSSIALPGTPVNAIAPDDMTPGLSDLPGLTPYEQVKKLFDDGVPCIRLGLYGWHIGRTFEADGHIKGAFMVGENVPKVPGAGPLFGEKFVATVMLGSPSAVDNLTPEQMQSYSSDNDWEVEFPQAVASAGEGFFATYRRNGEYIVVRFAHPQISPQYDDYSYFFRHELTLQ